MSVFDHLGRLLSPGLDWIQIEVTSFCSAGCVYCPHTIFRDNWVSRHLSIETFEKILPFVSRTKLLFLQGWGEPFMNPDFFAMAEMAKHEGRRVGVTTNGMMFDDDIIFRLVDQQIDIVAFSLAGADKANDAFRRGTSLEAVLNAIRSLHREKEASKSSRPVIHIAYLVLRSAIDSLEKLPQLLKGTGVAQVVISTLDLVPTKELEGEVLAPRTMDEYETLRTRLDAVASEARSLNIDMHYQIRCPVGRRAVCTENVLRALFISAAGEVSPCVFTNLPATDAAHVIDGIERPSPRLTFGNINVSSLSRIWREKAYAAFRESHVSDRPAAPCRDCPKLFIG
ncbi:MAG: radical SAM protein [Candidatus Abyssubacteria bacterium]